MSRGKTGGLMVLAGIDTDKERIGTALPATE
jgi:hypothetical protein